MATSTSNLGLIVPASNDVVDVTVLSTNFNSIDANIGVKPLTKFPTTFYTGMCVMVSNVMYIRTSSAWVPVGGKEGSFGLLGRNNTVGGEAAVTYTTTETGPIISVTVTVDNKRKYYISGAVHVNGKDIPDNKPVKSNLRIRFASGTSVTTAGTAIGSDTFANKIREGQVDDRINYFRRFLPSSSGQITIGLFLQVDSSVNPSGQMDVIAAQANNSIARPIYIRDVGAQ